MYSRKAGGGPATTAWSSNKPKQRGGSPSQGPNRSQSTVKSTHSRSKAAKSAEVLRLEKLIDAIEKGVDSKAGQAGCFCMARKHALSIHTPICSFCGLVLCELQSPASPCPSCFSPILSDHDRAALLARLEDEKTQQLSLEAEERERERQEQLIRREIQAGGGAFPTLAVSTGSGSATPQGRHTPTTDSGTHKVLSLNSRTRHVTVQTFKTPPVSAPTSRPASRVMTAEEKAEKERLKPVPAPADHIKYIEDAKPPETRPWLNLRGPTFAYVPDPSSIPEVGEQVEKKKKRPGKSKPIVDSDQTPVDEASSR